MPAAARPYVMASAVLAAASVVAVTPTVAPSFELPIRSIQTRLVDADSILNVPINLFEDFLNIPYNEIQGMDGFGASEFFTGSWWVPSSTNIWGIDPGDTTHTVALDGLIAPFPSLLDGVGGFNYEMDGLLAAELPFSASCDAQTCAPILPPKDITGITSIDRDIGFIQSIFGKAPDGASQMFENWFHVPISELLHGYTFPTLSDPSGVAYSGFGFGTGGVDGTNPFEGGTTGPDNLVPWSGLDFKYDPLQPLENFWTSLTAPVSSGPGVEIPTFTELFQGLQNMLAGAVVDFDPFVEGSPVCPAACNDDVLSVSTLLKLLDPGNNNPMINEWLTAAAGGTANGPTTDQEWDSIALLQTGFFNLNPTQLATVDADLAKINPELPALFTNAGILTDPQYLTWLTDPSAVGSLCTDTSCGLYGGLDPSLILPDLIKLFDPSFAAAGSSELSTTLGLFDPMTLVDFGQMLLQSMFNL